MTVAGVRCSMSDSADRSTQQGVSSHRVLAQHNSLSPSRARAPAPILRRSAALRVLATDR